MPAYISNIEKVPLENNLFLLTAQPQVAYNWSLSLSNLTLQIDGKHTNKIWIKSRCFSDFIRSKNHPPKTKLNLIKHILFQTVMFAFFLHYTVKGIFFNPQREPPGCLAIIFLAPARSLGYNDQGEVPRNVRPPRPTEIASQAVAVGKATSDFGRRDGGTAAYGCSYGKFSGKRNMWIIFWRNKKKGERLKEGFFGGGNFQQLRIFVSPPASNVTFKARKTSHVNDLAVWSVISFFNLTVR